MPAVDLIVCCQSLVGYRVMAVVDGWLIGIVGWHEGADEGKKLELYIIFYFFLFFHR